MREKDFPRSSEFDRQAVRVKPTRALWQKYREHLQWRIEGAKAASEKSVWRTNPPLCKAYEDFEDYWCHGLTAWMHEEYIDLMETNWQHLQRQISQVAREIRANVQEMLGREIPYLSKLYQQYLHCDMCYVQKKGDANHHFYMNTVLPYEAFVLCLQHDEPVRIEQHAKILSTGPEAYGIWVERN